jgi:hypothetical protein
MIIVVVLAFTPAFGQEQAEKDYETAMTLGNFQIDTGEYANAVASFKQALAIKPDDKAALVSLGITYSRSGDLPNARETLQKAIAIDPADARARYELGVVLFRLDDRQGAKQQFTAASSGPAADEALKTAAGEYLDIISGGGAEKKRYSLNVLAGEQHDSNVILDPDNPVVPGLRKADWRFITMLGGSYKFVDQDKGFVDAGYSFYDGHNHTLTHFDVRQHTLTLGGRYIASEKTRYDLHYQYEYSLVDGDKYSAIHQVRPSAAFSFTKASVTEFFYTYENKTFYDALLFPTNTDRTGNNNGGGLTHTIIFAGDSAVTAGYAYDRDATKTDFWDYSGNKGFLGLQSKVFGIGASLAASYYGKKYGGVQPGFSEKRQDGTQEYSVALDRNLAKSLSINLSNLYVKNRSNLPIYEYRRNLVSLVAVIRL